MGPHGITSFQLFEWRLQIVCQLAHVSLAPPFLHHVMYDEYFEIRFGVHKSVLDFSPPLPYMIIVQVLGYRDSFDNVVVNSCEQGICCRSFVYNMYRREFCAGIAQISVVVVIGTDMGSSFVLHRFIEAWWRYVASWNWVNYGSGSGLLPDGTMPLSEPVLTKKQTTV